MVFVKKSTFFSYVFFLAKKARKKHYIIFWIGKNRKEYFLDHKREVLKNSKKSTFYKGVSPWFLSKNGPFSHMFFFCTKKARKKHFLIFWIEKKRIECVLDQNRKVLKNSKKSTFCKGVSPWFLSKNRRFSHFFF